ncbi:MAG: 4Fe-4S dicluster domain-containing protein [Geobacter sp.]|nr:4Fe-4S dicluster domain-containing protein [Geobacter sp.]
MKIGIYLCGCGSMISEKICFEDVREAVGSFPDQPYLTVVDFICSGEGRTAFIEELKRERPERVVVAACSPRDHEATFRHCLSEAGINPYLLQMVNIREQIAWVTSSRKEATQKTIGMLRGAFYRVRLQVPLDVMTLEVCTDVLVIGAGPAGIKSALTLAEAGRRVTLVERTPSIGGLPMLFEETFPNLECSACMLEPAMMDVLHGEHSKQIELLTLAEVVEVKGSYGNFQVTVRQQARHVSQSGCISCGQCAAVCPALRSDGRKAIDFASDVSLPHVPFLDEKACLRSKGESCQICQDSCPAGAVALGQFGLTQSLELQFGAIVVAIGAGLYDAARLNGLGIATSSDVYDALQFQQMLSLIGPSAGEIVSKGGQAPASIAIVHCAGSLDQEHIAYCSGICCRYAIAFSHQILTRLPDCRITHYHRELVTPGKHSSELLNKLKEEGRVEFRRYENIRELALMPAVEMVVLCNAVVPSDAAGQLAALMDVPLDGDGFFQELHGQLDACQSFVKGIYPVGACREPMDIPTAVNEGTAAAALVLAGLRPGRKLEIEPVHAEVEADRCSGCRLCVTVCPYRAIAFDDENKKAMVNALLCRGCGACVSACPAAAIRGHGYSDHQIMAEIRGLLK